MRVASLRLPPLVLIAALTLAGATSVAADTAPMTTAPPAPGATAPGAAASAATPPAASAPAYSAPKGVGDCIWAAVPQSIRDTIGQAQSVGAVADAIRRLAGSRDDRIALAKQCNVPADAADPVELVNQVVESHTLEVWTAYQIQAAYGIGADRLDPAWEAVTADDRARLASWCAAGFDGPDAPEDALNALGSRLNLTGGDALSLLGYYAGARALFQQLGGTG